MKLVKQVAIAAIIVVLACPVVRAESGTPAGAGDQMEAPGGGKMGGVPTPLPPSAPAVSTTTIPGKSPGAGRGEGGSKPAPAAPHGPAQD